MGLALKRVVRTYSNIFCRRSITNEFLREKALKVLLETAVDTLAGLPLQLESWWDSVESWRKVLF